VQFIRKKAIEEFGLTYKKPKPNPFLLERIFNGH
jgi:hypothetical protein